MSIPGVYWVLCIAGFNAWNYSWKFWRHQMSELVIHADTTTLPVSEKHVVKSMSSLHVILFHNFVAA